MTTEWYTQEKISNAIDQVIRNWRRYNHLFKTKGFDEARDQWSDDRCLLCRIFDLEENPVPECIREGIRCPVLMTFGQTCHDREDQSGPLIENMVETLELIEDLKGYTIGRDDIEEEDDE